MQNSCKAVEGQFLGGSGVIVDLGGLEWTLVAVGRHRRMKGSFWVLYEWMWDSCRAVAQFSKMILIVGGHEWL